MLRRTSRGVFPLFSRCSPSFSITHGRMGSFPLKPYYIPYHYYSGNVSSSANVRTKRESQTKEERFHIHYFRDFFDNEGKLKTDVDEVIKWLHGYAIQPQYAFNWLITHYKLSNDTVAASNILQAMSQFSIEPDGAAYSLIINNFCSAGDISSAFRLYSKMIDRNLKPEPGLITNFIRSAIKTEKLSLVIGLLHTLSSDFDYSDIDPAVVGKLLDKFVDKDPNLKYFQFAIEKLSKLIDFLHLDELIVSKAQHSPDIAYSMIKKLKQVRFLPTTDTMSNIIRSFVKKKDMVGAIKASEFQETYIGHLSLSQLQMLHTCAALTKNVNLLHSYYDRIKEIQPNDIPWVSLIISISTDLEEKNFKSALDTLYTQRNNEKISNTLINAIFDASIENNNLTYASHLIEDFPSHFATIASTQKLKNLFNLLNNQGHRNLIPYLIDKISESKNNENQSSLKQILKELQSHHDTSQDFKVFDDWYSIDIKDQIREIYYNKRLRSILNDKATTGTFREVKQINSQMIIAETIPNATTIEYLLKYALFKKKDISLAFQWIWKKRSPYSHPSRDSLDNILKKSFSIYKSKHSYMLMQYFQSYYNYTPTTDNATTLVKFASSENQPEFLFNTIQSVMRDHDTLEDLFSLAVESLTRNNDIPNAIELLKNYVHRCDKLEKPVNSSVPGNIIINLIKKGEIESVWSVLTATRGMCEPHKSIFPLLIKYHLENNEYDEVKEVIKKLIQYQTTPDENIVSAIFNNIKSDTPVDFLGDIYEQLILSGLNPTSKIIHNLLQTLITKDRLDGIEKLLKIIENCMSSFPSLETHTITMVIEATLNPTNNKRLLQILGLVKRKQKFIPPDLYANALSSIFENSGKSKALQTHKDLKKFTNISLIFQSNIDLLKHLLKYDSSEANILLGRADKSVLEQPKLQQTMKEFIKEHPKLITDKVQAKIKNASK